MAISRLILPYVNPRFYQFLPYAWPFLVLFQLRSIRNPFFKIQKWLEKSHDHVPLGGRLLRRSAVQEETVEDVDAGVVGGALQVVDVLDDGAVDVPGEVLEVVEVVAGHCQSVAALALGGRGEHLLLAQDQDGDRGHCRGVVRVWRGWWIDRIRTGKLPCF